MNIQKSQTSNFDGNKHNNLTENIFSEFNCRICNSSISEFNLDFGNQPIVHHLLNDNLEKYEKYPFRLASCKKCGFIQLTHPIAPSILYDNYFTVSGWKNQPHVPRLVEVIENMSPIRYNSNILDIGCNDGSFLTYLKSKGYTNLAGIEPTKDAYALAISKGHDVKNRFFTENFAQTELRADSYHLITTRHVLEHIIDLDDFIRGIKYILHKDGTLVIEIPDSMSNIEYLDYSVWEEHVNYFTLNSIGQFLKKHGFIIVHHETTLFSGRSLMIFCKKNYIEFSSNVNFINHDRKYINKFFNSFTKFKSQLHEFLSSINRPIAVYGCGSRSSNFANFNDLGLLLTCFIDDQIEKQNLIVPGCNLSIFPFDPIYQKEYFLLLGVNTENETTVIRRNSLKSDSYVSILPPSIHLPEFWSSMIIGN